MFQEGSGPSYQKFVPFPLLLWTLSLAPALPIKHNPSLTQLLHWNQRWPKSLSLSIPCLTLKVECCWSLLLTTSLQVWYCMPLACTPPVHLLPFLSAWSCSPSTRSGGVHPTFSFLALLFLNILVPPHDLYFLYNGNFCAALTLNSGSASEPLTFFSVWLFHMSSKLEPRQVELLGFACPLPKCLSCECSHFQS